MINFRLMRHLWLFLAVAEEEHFGRAARRLGMTQPPLTEHIQTLEHALKIKLFERSRRGAKLTPEGLAILPAVRKFAAQMEQLERTVTEVRNGQTGVLTIGAITVAMLDVLPPLLEKLKTTHPRVTVAIKEIDSGEAVDALQTGDIDLAFVRHEGQSGKGIRVLPLNEEPLGVALHRSHPLAAQDTVALPALADEDFVMFSRQLNPAYFDALIACCQANGFSPRILHEVRALTSQVAFVGCGQGVALVPLAMAQVAPERVVVRPLQGQMTLADTVMLWCEARPNALVDAVVALASLP
ncbi:LysR family transcriptional regulator [Silvimonas amylolytica]|uniref:LysR family transcriptional regulator n=1 Tax=Silvimonas amylolytica TaxID=449663 RepID=A0ABQ2PPC4_9NEIS|nr:LysR family transcriptional regulator [Silvimonas amylolytica]GGP27090.1 LysR family transcriptional regulator [Silvimonas amylolytica]